jgi:hypothetical protein
MVLLTDPTGRFGVGPSSRLKKAIGALVAERINSSSD